MLDIREYTLARSVEEAYALVQKSPANRIIGGGCWLRLERRPYGTFIDLSALGLDRIWEEAGYICIGGGCTLRQLEKSPLLARAFGPVFADCTGPIVGVQFRNCATVGGSLYGRFGFSDLCTAFLALDAEVILHHGGTLPLEDFLKAPRHGERDILLSVRIRDGGWRAAFTAFRRTATDLPVLNAAAAWRDGMFRVAVGARPAAAALAPRAGELLAAGASADQAARAAAEELSFGTNLRGGAAYRQALCQVLVARCAERLKENGI